MRDFAFVSQATSAPNILIVAPAQGIKSTKALIAQAKQKAGQMNYGHAGVGSGTHITGELFRLAADINVVHTPYKGSPELGRRYGGRAHTLFLLADRQHARLHQGQDGSSRSG